MESVFVIGITNRLESVDPSVYREKRLDQLIHIPIPDLPTRKSIFMGFFAKMQNSLSESEIDELASLSDGWTGADIENLLREAALKIIRSESGDLCRDFQNLKLSSKDLNATREDASSKFGYEAWA
jgi:SpoVK/Ycf46/Vps4 family AAA+-type ATPase